MVEDNPEDCTANIAILYEFLLDMDMSFSAYLRSA